MKEAFAVVAALLAIAGNVLYVRDVIRGRVEPHMYTWLVWSIVSGVVFFGQVAKGAGVGALPTAASEIFTLFIFILSLKFGFKHITKTDTFFLIAALTGIVPWAVTNDPTLSVIIVVGIDAIGFIPTLRKTWREPATETPILYGTNVVRHILALFSLQAYNVATMLHSLVMILLNSCMTIVIISGKKGKG